MTKGLQAGNFYRDLVMVTFFLLLPISIIAAVILASLGVPQTFEDHVAFE
ncbi:MAG: potassium-transporting ATPase subunit KdpA, partial [Fervidicoccaceae archaeon]